ncbi:hypothetical protein ABK040_015177 [Willaertia magna]
MINPLRFNNPTLTKVNSLLFHTKCPFNKKIVLSTTITNNKSFNTLLSVLNKKRGAFDNKRINKKNLYEEQEEDKYSRNYYNKQQKKKRREQEIADMMFNKYVEYMMDGSDGRYGSRKGFTDFDEDFNLRWDHDDEAHYGNKKARNNKANKRGQQQAEEDEGAFYYYNDEGEDFYDDAFGEEEAFMHFANGGGPFQEYYAPNPFELKVKLFEEANHYEIVVSGDGVKKKNTFIKVNNKQVSVQVKFQMGDMYEDVTVSRDITTPKDIILSNVHMMELNIERIHFQMDDGVSIILPKKLGNEVVEESVEEIKIGPRGKEDKKNKNNKKDKMNNGSHSATSPRKQEKIITVIYKEK